MATLTQQCLDPAQNCACRMLRSLSRRVTRWYEAHLEDVDLTAGQFTLMVALQLKGPVSMSALETALGSDRTTLYRAVRPLRARGLVRELRSLEDRRVRQMELTSDGRAVLTKALPRWHRAHARFDEAIGDDAWTTMLPRLRSMSDAVDQLLERIDETDTH